MSKLGSKENPLVVNVHSDFKAQFVAETCNARGWHFVMGLNLADKEDLTDLERKLHPPILERTFEKVGRNEPCPCGSGLKYKKCHWDPVLDAYS